MPVLRVIILWHQHQPFYKDLVTGEYRLPWVRLHALKDYYGMVKLLDEFPNVHQTFNLVPSIITQIQDYVDGTAHDPFLRVAATPAKDLTSVERLFALQYLFQANPVNLIGRYPRYHELWERFRSAGDSPERAEKYFQPQDFTDLHAAKYYRPMLPLRSREESKFQLRLFTIPSCRWFATRTWAASRHSGYLCPKIGFVIPKTRVNNYFADSTYTSASSEYARSVCGHRKAAFPKRLCLLHKIWVLNGWLPMKAFSGAA